MRIILDEPARPLCARFDNIIGTLYSAPYMVPCTTHADCYRKRSRHPLTGSHYVCQTRFSLFDLWNTTDDNRVAYWNKSDGAAATFDPPAGHGVRVDSDYLRLYQAARGKSMALLLDGAVGCADRFVSRTSAALELRTYNGDPATAQVHGLLDYPRVLVAGSADPDGDGNSEPRVECGDPVECVQRRKFWRARGGHRG